MAVETSNPPDLSQLRIRDAARGAAGSPKWRRWFAAVLGLAVVTFGIVLALRRRVPVVELATAHAPGAEREVLLNASGYVTPRRRATVAAKITGRVTELYAEEGLRVTEGQVLARLDDADARVRLVSVRADRDTAAAALAELQVQLGNADRELARSQKLEASGVTSPQALDLARTTADGLRARIELTRQQIQAAEERVRVAQQDLDNCTVRSPFAGVVVTKDAQVGEMVSPISAGGGYTRTGIATVVDMNSIEIEVDVNESNIARVAPGMPVFAVLDAYPDWKIPGKVRTVIPTADRQKATVKVRISFDKLGPKILPDMGVKVTFLGDEPRRGAGGRPGVLVPPAAVREDHGSPIVFIYHDGRLERRAVRLGVASGADREVTAGLSIGDQVVVSSLSGLYDGEKAEIK
jgi:RND family efflux transporter MFP subunit